MNRLSGKQIAKSMSNDQVHRRMRSADDFWSDFRARARLRPQEDAQPAAGRALSWGWRWGLASGFAAVLVCLAFLRGIPQAQTSPAACINSLEVVASHSAVVIMGDEPSESTILWIVDMSLDNGDNA